jgi:hypothetical protein
MSAAGKVRSLPRSFAVACKVPQQFTPPRRIAHKRSAFL